MIGSPVGRDAQVLGAVVLVAPTSPVQESVSRWLLLLVVAGLATLLLTAYGVVVPFVGWILRPVHERPHRPAARARRAQRLRVPHRTGPPAGPGHLVQRDGRPRRDLQQQQRDLVADAAHQLGNLLTALRLRVENLGVAGADPDQVAALEETDRLNTIVESLLDLSQVGAHRVETGCVDVPRRPAPVRDVGADVRAASTWRRRRARSRWPATASSTWSSTRCSTTPRSSAAGAPVEVAVTATPAGRWRRRGAAAGARPRARARRRGRGRRWGPLFRGRQHQNGHRPGPGHRARLGARHRGALEVSVPRAAAAGRRTAARLQGAAPGSSASPPDAGPAARIAQGHAARRGGWSIASCASNMVRVIA